MFATLTSSILLYKSQWYTEWKQIDINDTISSHVKISMISLILSLSLTLYLNSLVYHGNIFGSSLKIFGNLRTYSEIIGKCSGTFVWPSEQFWQKFQKSSDSDRKSSKNHQKRLSHQYVYSLKNSITR